MSSFPDVAKTATRKEIRTAYLKKAKLYHPDLNSSPKAAARFKEVQEAYNTLHDPDKRQAYDSTNGNQEDVRYLIICSLWRRQDV